MVNEPDVRLSDTLKHPYGFWHFEVVFSEGESQTSKLSKTAFFSTNIHIRLCLSSFLVLPPSRFLLYHLVVDTRVH